MIHGFLEHAWGFAGVVDGELAERHHVVAPDARGHGDSSHVGPGATYHPMDFVADIAGLVDHLDCDTVSLVAHSRGGIAAAAFAGAFPEKVRRLVLIEGLGPPHDTTPTPERVSAWIARSAVLRAKPQSQFASLEDAARKWCERDSELQYDLALELANSGTRRLDDGRYQLKHDPLLQAPEADPFTIDFMEGFWRRITAQVLYVSGDRSWYNAVDSMSRRQAAFRDLRTVEIADCGHMPHRDKPQLLQPILLDFLS